MTDDLVKRLREWQRHDCWQCDEFDCRDATHAQVAPEACVCPCHIDYTTEAADEIERLRAQVDDWRWARGGRVSERRCVLWVRQTGTGTWLAYYSPPLEDAPTLLAEAYTADEAVHEGLERLRRLEARDG